MNKNNCRNFSIIIPCYNEERVIKSSLRKAVKVLGEEDRFNWNIVCVNDGSKDETKSRIKEFIYKNESRVDVKYVELEKNTGKGSAIKRGLQETDADYYGYVDADLSVGLEDNLSSVIKELDETDLVIAKRKKEAGYPWYRKMGNKLFSKLANFLFGIGVSDPQCGFKFFRHKVKSAALNTDKNWFSFDLEFLVRCVEGNFKIKEIEVDWSHNQKSSVIIWDSLRYFLDLISIMEVKYSSRKFKLIYGFISVFFTLLMFGWVLYYGYFFSDDFTWLWHGKKILSGEVSLLTARMSSFYSPFFNGFYAFMYKIFGVAAWPYFLFGLVIHSLNSFLVGLLTREVVESWAAGLLATILFVLVGGAYEPLVWIGSNMHSVVALWILLSSLFLIYSYTNQNSYYLFASLVAFVLALATKEIAVILPPILGIIAIYFWFQEKESPLAKERVWYWICAGSLSIAYAVQQYIWQKQSVWVSSGTWELGVGKLARLPVVLMDILVPLKPVLNDRNALYLTFLSILFFGYILYRFRKEKSVWFGFIWAILAVLPVLFFATNSWWETLPSRYTYTARIGMMILVSVVIYNLITKAKQVRVAHKLFWVLIFFSLFHTLLMGRIVLNEYSYVYNTGRTLVSATENISSDVKKIYVAWERPFTKNKAHIVGILDLKAGLSEDKIEFLQKSQQVQLKREQILLDWNSEKEKYVIIK